MDRLISEQQVLKVLDNLKANFTCYDSVTLDEVASRIKAIPSAEPYKGMTNGEVIKGMFPQLMIFEENASKVVWGRSESETKWWNAPYEGGEG